METQMINHFEAALAAMSDEDFMAAWRHIKSKGGQGPTAAEFIKTFGTSTSTAKVHFSSLSNDEFGMFTNPAGEYNYAMAA